MDEFIQFFAQYQDHLAPKLDVYEQAIYLYVARHTVAEGKRDETIGFKSARRKLAFGIGKAGTPPSERIIYDKLRSLESKGCIKILSSERSGTRVHILLPAEIPGLRSVPSLAQPVPLGDMDFFSVPQNRKLILEREGWRCFYCLAKLDKSNHVLEHVVSRPEGDNSYRNIVAACRRCNNRKDSALAEDFLRSLYREGILSGDDLTVRLSCLDRLRAGELQPSLGETPNPAMETDARRTRGSSP